MDIAALTRPRLRLAKLSIVRRWANQTVYSLGAAAVSALAASVASAFIDGGKGAQESLRSMVEFNGVMPLVILALVVAPLIETMLLAWVILLLLDRRINPHVVVFLSATLWTASHSIGALSGLALFVPFLTFSYLFVQRHRQPHADGFLLAMMAHFYFNLIALIGAFFGGILST